MGESVGTAGGDLQPPAVRARGRLRELARQLRDDVDTVADPRTRALFATTADLLAALEEAFADAETQAQLAVPR